MTISCNLLSKSSKTALCFVVHVELKKERMLSERTVNDLNGGMAQQFGPVLWSKSTC
jgi:hypothetical protein